MGCFWPPKEHQIVSRTSTQILVCHFGILFGRSGGGGAGFGLRCRVHVASLDPKVGSPPISQRVACDEFTPSPSPGAFRVDGTYFCSVASSPGFCLSTLLRKGGCLLVKPSACFKERVEVRGKRASVVARPLSCDRFHCRVDFPLLLSKKREGGFAYARKICCKS